MAGAIVIVGLVLYPLAVHVLVLAGMPDLALAGLVIVAMLNLALVRERRRVLPLAVLYLLLSSLALTSLFSGSVFALFLPPVLVNVALMLLFGHSLRARETSLVERFMRIEYGGRLAPALARHARVLTATWTGYFALVALASVLLAAIAPLETWSWFVNVLNFVLAGLLFLWQQVYRMVHYGEYGRVMPWTLFIRLARLKLSDPDHPLFGEARR